MKIMEFYLLSAKISGVKNIQKCLNLEFFKKTIDRKFDPEQYRIKGIFGENGFGKTAIITAFSIFQSLILKSNYLQDTSTQEYLSETINKITKEFLMECEFAHVGEDRIDVYSYSICLKFDGKSYRIKNESLAVRNGNNPKSKFVTIYSVKDGSIDGFIVGTNYEKWSRASVNLLPKQSFPSIFLSDGTMTDGSIAANSVYHLLDFVSRMFISLRNEDQHTLYFLTNSTPTKDRSIEDIVNTYSKINEKKVLKELFPSYERRVKGMERFLRLFKPDLRSIDIEKRLDGDYYSCQLNMNYGDYVINREFESEGIKKLISLYDALRVAANGGIVFIDEIDSNINCIYLDKLIEYMMLFGKGQLCFTSHNIDIMQVLKDIKYSIDFLNSNQEIVRWINNGNKSPVTTYRNGLIEGMPYNIFATDFVNVFGEE